LIQDAQGRSPEMLIVLKTIGVLNLITTTGNLRATPQLVTLALCHRAESPEQAYWQSVIDQLLKVQGLITHRRQLDDLRIWQGSDFNVEAAIQTEVSNSKRVPLAEILATAQPLKPLVAQRHYVQTGTLRFFEQVYVDGHHDLESLACSEPSHDGLIAYWLDTVQPTAIPSQTQDGKPLVLIQVTQLHLLQTRSAELQALQKLRKQVPELQIDKVAEREIKQRLVDARRLLDETLLQSFSWGDTDNRCWLDGQLVSIPSARAFQAEISNLCDRTYDRGLRLDNELINRRELSSQGSKARRELLEAMLEHADQERLGLQGYGPEVSMYYSVLKATRIHRPEEEIWGFYPPPEDSGAFTVWQAIANFCFEATEKQRSLAELYQQLEQPPYGVKSGTIPVFLAAVLLCYVDEVSVYKEGTFIPVLGPEHFELLVKDPSRFAVKHIEVAGVRSQVFRELEAVLRSSGAKRQQKSGARNTTVLSVVKP
jgi:hypothetical protein